MSTRSRSVSVGGWAVWMVAALPHLAVAQQTLERVTVTGSHVQRVAGEMPTAVQVITAREIERSGARTALEVFLQLPAFAGFNPEADVLVAPERASIAFRNLDARNVLVLLEGRRLTRHSIEANDQLTDLNTIPMAAIDRIEVLKDGAAALYGSDAVAGVVNFILKKDQAGGEAGLHQGQSQSGDGRETHLWGVRGIGDKAEQGYNLMLSAEYFRRTPVMRRDRGVSSRRSSSMTSAFPDAGNVYDAGSLTWLGTVAPCRDELVDLGFGPICPAYPNDTINLIPGLERGSLFAAGEFRLFKNLNAHAEALVSGSRMLNQLAGTPGSLFWTAPDGGYSTTDGGSIPAGTPLQLDIRYAPDGIRRVLQTQHTTRLVAGLEGRSAPLAWSFDVGHARTYARSNLRDFFDFTSAQSDLNAGTFDPVTATTRQLLDYNVDGRVDTRTSLTFSNLKATIDVASLPGGTVSLALGSSGHRESLAIEPDEVAAAGKASASGLPVAALGRRHRDVSSLFGELSLPVHADVQTQLALRHDFYSDFGHITTPKLAGKWTVSPQFAWRGSFGRGFVAPDLEKLYRDGYQVTSVITDADLCGLFGLPPEACVYQVPTTIRANRNLKPETSRSLAFGLVTTPLPQSSIQVDWFRIDKRNTFDTILQAMVDDPSGLFDGRPGSSYFTRSSSTGQVDSAELSFVNIGRESTSGVELEARYRFPAAPWGRVTLENQGSYVHHYKRSLTTNGPMFSFLGLINQPRFRNVFSVHWSVAAIEFSTFWRTQGGFLDAAVPGDVTPQTRRLPTHTTLDWHLAIKDLATRGDRLMLGMKNALNKAPSESELDPNVGAGHPTSQSAVGRFLYLGYTVPF